MLSYWETRAGFSKGIGIGVCFEGSLVHFEKVWVCAVDVVINNAILLVRDSSTL